MNLNNIFKKIATKFIFSGEDPFTYDVDKQKNYIAKFPEPEGYIERSYFQYKCQMKLAGILTKTLTNIAGLILIIPSIAAYYINGKKRNKKINFLEKDAVFLTDGFGMDIIPKEIKQQYKDIYIEDYKIKQIIIEEDIIFISKIILKYPLSWYFIYKCLLKIGIYRSIISNYNPQAIITNSEYSFTSSALTKFCENNGIKHVNIMHGEKLYYIRDSFIRYHEYYIWDSYYKKLLIELRAYKDQFIISTPDSLVIDFNKYPIDYSNKVDYKYYLGGESAKELAEIYQILLKIQAYGYNVSIRPHPRYTNIDMLKKIFINIEIENAEDVTIINSIANTDGIISLYSSVLNQGYHSGKKIIIDDITNNYKFNKLDELEYFIFSKEYIKLSALLNSMESK